MKILAYCGLYTTEPGDELTDEIPVKRKPNEGLTPALEKAIPDVQKGDLLQIIGKAQRSNNLHKAPFSLAGGRNVGCGFSLAVIVPGQTQPIPLTSWTGSNVDADIHHMPSLDGQWWKAPETYGVVTVRLYLKSSNTSAVTTGKLPWSVRLDRGYGHLSVLHMRPIEWPPEE